MYISTGVLIMGNYQGRNFGPSGTQLRARSNFGLGFALTHILIKSDNSHRRKSIFDLAVADFDLAVADFDLAAAD